MSRLYIISTHFIILHNVNLSKEILIKLIFKPTLTFLPLRKEVLNRCKVHTSI